MQIRRLKVSNFRGIAMLDWKPGHSFCCLIGPGDSGKSTVLDAAEACLSSRWYAFAEPDFTNADTTNPISIEATVGELSASLKSDERFGLFIRGWTTAGELRDEPEDDDEPVLTVRLTVDASMEPSWELICDRTSDPRALSNRDILGGSFIEASCGAMRSGRAPTWNSAAQNRCEKRQPTYANERLTPDESCLPERFRPRCCSKGWSSIMWWCPMPATS